MYKQIKRLNFQAIEYLQKQTIQEGKLIVYHSQLKTDLELSEALINQSDGCLVPTQPAKVAGSFVITQVQQGLVDSLNQFDLSLCFCLNNQMTIASTVTSLWQLGCSDRIQHHASVLIYGKLAEQVREADPSQTGIVKLTKQNTIEDNVLQLQKTCCMMTFLSSNPLVYQNFQVLKNEQINSENFTKLMLGKQSKFAPTVQSLYVDQYFRMLSNHDEQQQQTNVLRCSMVQQLFVGAVYRIAMNYK